MRVVGIEPYSKAGKVPVLMVDGARGLGLARHLRDRWPSCFPASSSGPQAPEARRVARSVCAEMHSGFQDLRGTMPMNIRKQLSRQGHDARRAQRTSTASSRSGPSAASASAAAAACCSARFSIADAFYAPVVMRFQTYAVELPRVAQEYCEAVLALAAVQRVERRGARARRSSSQADEPYAKR